jgi:thiamine-phosphate pyrophosphorylase
VKAHLQLVTDPRAGDLARAVERAAHGGLDSVQVRDRGAASGELLTLAAEIARVVRGATRLLVNDRVDVALAVRAHGVQLPARGIPPIVARALLEPWQLIGVSVHSVDEAVAAAAAGADHVVFGHVFPTTSHAGEDPRGLDALRAVVDAVRIPVLAIGGITAGRCASVLAAGASGVAVIGAIIDARDPESATRALRDALDAHGDVARPFPERRD